ncbi:MAG: hypothetical protein ACSHXH_18780 [Marivita sp.]|uniref:hypothetical protein n=1 Tax=Marivita sp. TaxID=2003365 RepID=UPI003EF3AFC9
MASPLLILGYLVLASVVAFLGRKRAVGCFVLSLLLTPFVIALVLMVAAPRTDP